MKIVHVVPALTKGGGERVATELANHATREGHIVTVIVHHSVDPTLLQDTLDSNVQVVFVSHQNRHRLWSSFHWIRKNRHWLFEQDILHCHLTYGSLFGTIVQFFRMLSSSRKPVIIETYHAVGMAIPSWHRWIHSKLAAGREGVAFMAEDAFWNNFRKKHPNITTKTILNGVSISHFKKPGDTELERYREKLSIPEQCRFVVGTIGMLRPDRQPWRYIAIFEQVLRNVGPSVHFIIGGDGSEMGKIKLLATASEARNHIHFTGLVTNPALVLSMMDLYVSLSVRNAVGVSMFEAALSHVPVVGIQVVNNYQASIDDWVWSSSNDSEVAARISYLLEHPQEREQLRNCQYQYAIDNHSTDSMSKAYYSFYNEVLHLKSSKSLKIKHQVK